MCQPVSTPSVSLRQREEVGPAAEVAAGEREVALPARQVVGELVELHQAEGGRQLGRLEVPAQLVEDEQVVVLERRPSMVREEPAVHALAGAEELDLRAPSPAPQQQRPVGHVVVVEADHPAGAGRGDDVREGETGEADVGPGTGRRAAQGEAERVAGVLDDLQAVGVGDRPDAIPVGGVADQVRRRGSPGCAGRSSPRSRRRRSGTCPA